VKGHPLGCTIENLSVSLTSFKLTQLSYECGKPVLNEANRFTVLTLQYMVNMLAQQISCSSGIS